MAAVVPHSVVSRIKHDRKIFKVLNSYVSTPVTNDQIHHLFVDYTKSLSVTVTFMELFLPQTRTRKGTKKQEGGWGRVIFSLSNVPKFTQKVKIFFQNSLFISHFFFE